MISLRLYDRNGTTLLGLLPEPTSWKIGAEFNDVGAIQFDYPSNGVNADLITDLREVAVVDETGNEITNGRYVITNINRNRTATTGNIAVTGKSILWRLETALAYPTGGIASGETERIFELASAGTVLRTLIDAAQTRGALAGLTCSFTTGNDSNSVAWSGNVTQNYAARSTILSILRGLSDLGLVEVSTSGRVINATNVDGIGTDRTLGANPIVLRHGYNLTEAPEQTASDKIAGVLMAEGDKGLLIERTDPTAIATYGRLETSLTASGVTDAAVVQSIGDSYLANLITASRQITVGLSLQDGAPVPLKDFTVGDYVYTATTSGLERVRVRQIVLSMDNGVLTASATLGDRIYENEIKTARRLAAITSGGVAAGSGEIPAPVDPEVVVVPDDMPPAEPTGLTGTADAYLDGTVLRGRVNLSWIAPTLNEDGTPLEDLRQYEVEYRKTTDDPFEFGGAFTGTTAVVSNLAKNTQYRFRVTAVDASNNRSARSTVFIISTPSSVGVPSSTSAPTVTSRLGTLTVTWNGLNSTGGAMPVDLDYVAVHVGTTAGFTPSAANYKDRLTGAGFVVLTDLTYNQAYYVKLVAYNTSGVASSVSASGTGSVTPLVNADLIGQVISSANFQGGAVDTAALASGAVSAAKLVDGAVTGTKISADAITADKIAAGAIGADEIAANAIVAGKIAANAVTAGTIAALAISADKLAANAITADKIEAGAITAVKIAANAITADKLSATAIDGKTITGSTVQTSAGSTAVVMDVASNSIGFKSGGSYAGFLTPIGAGAVIMHYGSSASATAYPRASVSASTASLAADGSNSLSITASGNNMQGVMTFGAAVTVNGKLYAAGYATTGNSANVHMFSNGEILRSSSSSERYKENIVDLTAVPELDPKKLYDLPVRAFSYKDGYLSPTDDRYGTLVPGFIAEEVDAVYPIAADYAQGPESWNDRMLVPALLSLIQDLNARVVELEAGN